MGSFSADNIENAVWQASGDAGSVSVEELAARVGKLPEKEPERGALLERIARCVDNSARFFERDGRYFPKPAFFTGGEFVITPSELEIEEGLLFPGHRFAPFCSADVYFSEVALTLDGGREAKPKEVKCNFHELVGFHALLGAGQIYDLVVAEHPGNMDFLRGSRNAKIVMTAFDMAAFYRKHDFKSEDALLVKVEDYDEGAFAIKFLPAAARDQVRRRLWIEKYENALAKVIPDYAEYEEIPELLALGFFVGGRELFGAEGASLDEFIAASEEVELRAGGDGTYLALHSDFPLPGDGDHHHDHADCDHADCNHDHHHGGDGDLPGGISLSSGTVESIPAILKELGSTLSLAELDAFIFEEFSSSSYDADALYRRLFGDLTFADDAQEASFRVMFEERFEALQDHFDRENDPEVAELRSQILELVQSRLELLGSTDDVPEGDLETLAKCSLFFNELLTRIHTPGYTRAEDELREELLEKFDELASLHEMIVEQNS